MRGEGGDDEVDKSKEGGRKESWFHCFPLVDVDITYSKGGRGEEGKGVREKEMHPSQDMY